MEINIEDVGYARGPSRLKPVHLTRSAPLFFGCPALRSAILDWKQDRLRFARLSPQRSAQAQDSTDVQVQSGTGTLPPPPFFVVRVVAPFLVLIDSHICGSRCNFVCSPVDHI